MYNFLCTEEYSTHDTSLPIKLGCNSETMYVFLNVLNINSIMNLDVVANNRHGRWTGNKVLVNVGFMYIYPSMVYVICIYIVTVYIQTYVYMYAYSLSLYSGTSYHFSKHAAKTAK